MRCGDRDSRRQRQAGAETFEQRCEGRNHLPENDPDHRDGDQDDGGRIDHRRAHRGAQFYDLFNVGRQTLENRIQDTARLTGGDHVRVEIVERLGMLAQRVRERRTRLNILTDLEQDLLERTVLLLRAKNLKALHQRKTGVDHHRELTGEDRDLFPGDTATDFRKRKLFALLGDRRDDDLLLAQRCNRGFFGFRNEHAFLDASASGPTFPTIVRHSLAPRSLSGGVRCASHPSVDVRRHRGRAFLPIHPDATTSTAPGRG